MLKAGGGQSVARMQPRGVWRLHFCAGRGWGCPTARKPSPSPPHTHPSRGPSSLQEGSGAGERRRPDVGRQMNVGPSAHGNPLKEFR